jgi:hypothetical protein
MNEVAAVVRVPNEPGLIKIPVNLNLDTLIVKLDIAIKNNKLDGLEDLKDFKSLFFNVYFTDVVCMDLIDGISDSVEMGIGFLNIIESIYNIKDLDSSILHIVSEFVDNAIDETNIIIESIKDHISNTNIDINKIENIILEDMVFRDSNFSTGIGMFILTVRS